MLLISVSHDVNLRNSFLGRIPEASQFDYFAFVADSPEDHVALLAEGHESLRIGQVLGLLDLLPVHCESAEQLIELCAVE